MTVLAVTDITLLSPDFGNAINNVHNILMPVAYVVVAGGLTWATIQAHAERSLNTVMVQLIRIALVALFLINIGLVGNFINGAVSSIEEQTGINGNPMAAFVAAIKQKFGIDLSVLTNATNAMFPGGSSVGSINTLPAGTTPTISTYGYEQPGDPTYDPQSAQGSGAFPFSSAPGSLMEGTSFAVSPSLSAGLTPGQTIQVNLTNGQSITGVYADKTADSYNGQTLYRVDIYDPNQQYSNLSGVGISSITPVSSPPNFAVATEGDTSVGFGAATQPPSNLGEFWNGMLHPMESIELGLLGVIVLIISFIAAMIQWFMAVVQSILFYCEVAVAPLFAGFLVVPGWGKVARAFMLSFFGICLWPLAFVVSGLVTQFLLGLAVNAGNNPLLGTINLAGVNLLWLLGAAVWVGFSSIAGPWIVSRQVTAGASGIADMLVGASAATRSMARGATFAYRGAVAGAAARNGASVNGLERPNFALKPRD